MNDNEQNTPVPDLSGIDQALLNLQNEARLHQRASRKLRTAAATIQEARLLLERGESANGLDPVVPVDNRYASMPQIEALIDTLRRAEGPLHRRRIFRRMKRHGAPVETPKALAPLLSRDKRIVRVGPGRWILRGKLNRWCAMAARQLEKQGPQNREPLPQC